MIRPFPALRAAALAAVLLPVACQDAAMTAEPEEKETNVLAIAFDGLKPDHVYAVDEPIRVGATLTRDGVPEKNARFRYVLEGDASVYGYTWVDTDENGRGMIETKLGRPGFVRAYAFAKNGPEGKDGKEFGARFGVGIDPLAIRAARPKPADFDAYWDDLLAQLKALPIEVEVSPLPVDNANYADKVDMFDVKLNALGDKPFIYGYLCMPKNPRPKSLPIVMSYQGAGFRSAGQTYYLASTGKMVLDIGAHGLPNGQPPEFYAQAAKDNEPGFRFRGFESRDTIYFRNMILRAVRALQYMKTRPEWDGKIVALTGGSMGAGQSLAVAGLDPDVTFCFAAMPTFCDHGAELDGREGGWPKILQLMKKHHPDDAAALERAAASCDYIDNAFFAARVRPEVECLLTVGFFDNVCVPASVYAAYNALPEGNKRIINDINSDHAMPQSSHQAGAKALQDHVARLQAQAR